MCACALAKAPSLHVSTDHVTVETVKCCPSYGTKECILSLGSTRFHPENSLEQKVTISQAHHKQTLGSCSWSLEGQPDTTFMSVLPPSAQHTSDMCEMTPVQTRLLFYMQVVSKEKGSPGAGANTSAG